MAELHMSEPTVVHQFKNHLSVILGFCEFLLADLPEGDRRNDVGEIHQAATAATALVPQLAGYCHPPDPRPPSIGLDEASQTLREVRAAARSFANPVIADANATQPLFPTALRLPKVLVVDDEESVRSFLRKLLMAQGYAVDEAIDGPSALASIAAHSPDVVLLDVNLPEQNGFEVCRRVKQDASTRLTPVIIVTALDARAQRAEGLEAGADDFLTKPVDTLELLARVRSLVRMKAYTDDLDSASSIIMTLAAMIEARDGYTTGHCHRMANFASSLGRKLGVSEADLQVLYRGGFLHDIGMLAISDSVLRKTGRLEPDEYELIKSHPVIGDTLCANLRSLQPLRPIIRWHHERLNGSGYPDGLHGDDIPLVAQIVGVVDVFEAITTPRPYQSPVSAEEGMGVLRTQVRRGWLRSDIVEAFAALIQSRSTLA